MSRTSPKMRHFAKRLTVYERRLNPPSETTVPPAFQVCEKLRVHLAIFMGKNGFRELLSCALPRAQAEIPWLGAVKVKADGAFEGLEELHSKRKPDELFEGGIVLVAQLLGLLVAFIGEDLTLRFVREVWPDVPLDNLDFGKGVKDEKTE
ncbi:MAG: hypothetical protein NT154_43345 [Verrucomicrobia bacterium]|nr:hypothetical protein [Verrucomicrobiota bacterium]